MSVRKTRYARVLRIGVSVLLLMLVFTALPIRGESGIYDSVIRLHVIADSNEESDQRMKLFVRDRILSECASVLISEEKSAESAVLSLSADLSMVKETAARALEDYCAENGVRDIPTVACELGRERYPYREYERLCFPKGEYYSLRVIIGEGKGENWWCVLFPPMCFGAAVEVNADESEEEEFISVGITSDQYKIISESDKPKYRLRFRILEIIESWFE